LEWRYLAKLSDGDPHASLVAHSASVLSLRFLDDDTLLTCRDGRLAHRDLESLESAGHRPSSPTGVLAAASQKSWPWLPSGALMFYRSAWSYASGIKAVDLQRGTEGDLLDAKAAVRSLDISLDQKVLAVASANQVNLWDLDRKAWLQSFETEASAVTQGLFSPDGNLLVVADESGQVAFWNVAEHHKIGVFTRTYAQDWFSMFEILGRWAVACESGRQVTDSNLERRRPNPRCGIARFRLR
jgi:WD40 repeat protein